MTIHQDVWIGQGAANPGIPDPAVAPLLMGLRDCLCEQVAKSINGPVCRCYVTWGSALPVQDGCLCTCEDGTGNGDGWVKLDSMEPDLAGTATALSGWCPTGWTATVSMGVYRCVPVAEETQVLPAEEVTDTSLALLSDMAALWRVLSCCTALPAGPGPGEPPPGPLDDGVRVVAWNPIDTAGGCAGGYLTIQLPLAGTNGCATWP